MPSKIDTYSGPLSFAWAGYKKGAIFLHGDTNGKCCKKYGVSPPPNCPGLLAGGHSNFLYGNPVHAAPICSTGHNLRQCHGLHGLGGGDADLNF